MDDKKLKYIKDDLEKIQVNPPNITKTRIIRFDNQKNVWVVYVNTKEQYSFATEEEALSFLKQAYAFPKVRILGNYRNKGSVKLGHVYEILKVYNNLVKAKSLHTGEIEYLNRKDIKVYPLFLKRCLKAKINDLKEFKFNIGDSVKIVKKCVLNGVSYEQKEGVISDRWVDYKLGNFVNCYKVDMLEDASIIVSENFLTKKTIEKKSSVKYMDLESKEMKELDEFGLTDGDNLPEEVTKDGKKYKKVIISD
jgi:hypothetical protein